MFFSKNVKINEIQTEMSATSLRLNSSTDVFNNVTTTVSYFPLLFKEQHSVAVSDLHRIYKSRSFMTFSGYLIKQSLLTIGQEVVSTTPLHAFCLTDNFLQLVVLDCLAT